MPAENLPSPVPRPPAFVIRQVFLLAALYSTALRGGTYTNPFNSLANDTPNGAISTSLGLGGGLLNGAAANATLISNRKDTNGAGTINVGIVKTGVGTTGATALRLADKATGSATAALVIPVLDANAVVTEFTYRSHAHVILENQDVMVPDARPGQYRSM